LETLNESVFANWSSFTSDDVWGGAAVFASGHIHVRALDQSLIFE
jgi:hypothetical protein